MLVSLGIVSMSTSDRSKMLTQKNVEYAQKIQALNAAHTAIQVVMQEINEKGIDNMDQAYVDERNSNNSWTSSTVNGANIDFYIEFLNSDWETNPYFEEDKVRLNSTATVEGSYEAKVQSVYLVAPFSNFVPPFESPLTIATDQVSSFNTSGSASIYGTSPDGSDCEDKPTMTIANQEGSSMDSTSYANELNNIETQGSPKVKVRNDLSYEPTDELIDRLEDSPERVNIDGNYGDSLGTADDPGVFFVQDGAKLTGKQTSGYGIMVVQSGGDLSYEGELSVAGNFEWNGLIIFENAYDFDGKGTPTLNGSVLVGSTSDDNSSISIDINGNLKMQYDCRAEKFAQMAAANAVKQNKYTREVSLEETRVIK